MMRLQESVRGLTLLEDIPYLDAEGDVPYVDAEGRHDVYGYETRDGGSFEIWDARHELGRVPVVLLSPDGKVGRIRTVSASPGYWRKLKVGESRVLVDMTEITARATADQIIFSREQMKDSEPLSAAQRSQYVEDCAQRLVSSGVAATATVTRGMLEAFEQALPPTAVSFAAALGLIITLESRTGETIDKQQWERLHDDPSYETVAFNTVQLPGGSGRFVSEIRTRWLGVIINGDRRSLFDCTVRIRHNCDAPLAECTPGPWKTESSFAEEQAAREHHKQLVAEATSDKATEYCDRLARIMDRAGLAHFPEDVVLLFQATVDELDGNAEKTS